MSAGASPSSKIHLACGGKIPTVAYNRAFAGAQRHAAFGERNEQTTCNGADEARRVANRPRCDRGNSHISGCGDKDYDRDNDGKSYIGDGRSSSDNTPAQSSEPTPEAQETLKKGKKRVSAPESTQEQIDKKRVRAPNAARAKLGLDSGRIQKELARIRAYYTEVDRSPLIKVRVGNDSEQK